MNEQDIINDLRKLRDKIALERAATLTDPELSPCIGSIRRDLQAVEEALMLLEHYKETLDEIRAIA